MSSLFRLSVGRHWIGGGGGRFKGSPAARQSRKRRRRGRNDRHHSVMSACLSPMSVHMSYVGLGGRQSGEITMTKILAVGAYCLPSATANCAARDAVMRGVRLGRRSVFENEWCVVFSPLLSLSCLSPATAVRPVRGGRRDSMRSCRSIACLLTRRPRNSAHSWQWRERRRSLSPCPLARSL